jgi:hypothetical protein
MIDLDAMSAALEPTRQGLDAAGFALSLADDGGRLCLTVIAGEAACEDCLVPKSLFKQMASDEIREAGLAAVDLEILYPIDARRKQS